MKSLIIASIFIHFVVAQNRAPRPLAASSGANPEGNARIISENNEFNFDGTYQWSFQSDNGISAQESGQIKNANSQEPVEEAQGNFAYTAPDGSSIEVRYVANEGGFQPQGAHLPVPPPIPIEIQKALEWNAAHPEEDDAGRGSPRRL